jgi:chaperone required for assembly of F1-ATPase
LKRFYTIAEGVENEDDFTLVLDGKPAFTPGKNRIALPNAAAITILANEWNAQGETVNAASMPFTRLVNTAIDGVAITLDEVRGEVLRYGRSDLIFYRAGEPERLVIAQEQAWDPVLAWARDALNARFILVQSITFTDQPSRSLDRLAEAVSPFSTPFAMAALSVMTTLTGSLLITLAHIHGVLNVEAAWSAAHVDEHYQEQLWGQDEEAIQRRKNRFQDFEAASRMVQSLNIDLKTRI